MVWHSALAKIPRALAQRVNALVVLALNDGQIVDYPDPIVVLGLRWSHAIMTLSDRLLNFAFVLHLVLIYYLQKRRNIRR